jgi:hypothetical protein
MLKVIVFTLIIGSGLCLAQADRAAVTGTISDPSHSVVPNAKVLLVYSGTGLRRETQSSSSGVFRIGGLPIGECYLEVGAAGFRSVRTKPFVLTVGDTRTLDVAMELASAATSVEVRDTGDTLTYSEASIRSVTSSQQLNELPVNGRNWQSFMALAPGAVDAANGSNTSVRFLATGGDDVNYRVDGVDATSIRNQNMRLNSRLLMSEDAIAEFRVNSALFTAESGGSGGGQVEVVSKSGSNSLHGSAFEYARDATFDARSPWDPAALPPFRLNQFGGSVGGPVIRNRTFYFLSYEGLRQNKSQTFIGYVPTQAFRDRALQTSPVIKPLLEAFPAATGTTADPNVGEWRGIVPNMQNEDVGTLRVDHSFNDRWSSYFRFTRNHATTDLPVALDYGNTSVNAPVNGVFELLYVISPRSTNELRLGGNWVPWDSDNPQRNDLAVAVGPLTTAPDSIIKITHSLSESVLDNLSMQRGRHTWKAGIEVRRVVTSTFYSYDGTISYASMNDFAANKADTVVVAGYNPARTMPKTEYFGYVQDEWKIRPNLTANLGLRYEFYNELTERYRRILGFNIQYCGGYCPYGELNGTPAFYNFAPRVSLAWAPERFHGNTVIRVGGGRYYGDGQIGVQLQGISYNGGNRFSLSQLTTPGLAYPVDLNPDEALGTAPYETERFRKSETYQQWTVQIQQRLPWGFTSQVGYTGMESYHLGMQSPQDNLVNPATGKRTLPNFDQVSYSADWGVGSFHALMAGLHRTSRSGLFLSLNYTYAHAINDSDIAAENSACRSCSKGSAAFDARHNLYAQASYPLRFGRSMLLRDWEISGVSSMRTGLPLTVTVNRPTTVMADGNNLAQRPNIVPGVSLIPPGGQTINRWINPAAFSIPAAGTWGNAGTSLVRAPGLFQFDTALSRTIKITEGTKVSLRMEGFNVFNHPQLGTPNLNFSSLAAFGRIGSVSNSSPVGTGTARSIQFAARFTF